MDSTKIIEWLKSEYVGIRTGRATPSILDAIQVEAYGSKMAINQLATVTIEDPKTLRVTPWDKPVAKEIDRAVRESNLGLSCVMDANGLRISFPELTADRRTALVKVLKQKLEEARIRVRTERQRLLNEMEDLDEDSQKRAKDKLQKEVDELNSKLEEIAAKKEAEIMG
jgi:ribosome recycling factor